MNLMAKMYQKAQKPTPQKLAAFVKKNIGIIRKAKFYDAKSIGEDLLVRISDEISNSQF